GGMVKSRRSWPATLSTGMLVRACEAGGVLDALYPVHVPDVVNGTTDFRSVLGHAGQCHVSLVDIDVEIARRDGAVFHQGGFRTGRDGGIVDVLTGCLLALHQVTTCGKQRGDREGDELRGTV